MFQHKTVVFAYITVCRDKKKPPQAVVFFCLYINRLNFFEVGICKLNLQQQLLILAPTRTTKVDQHKHLQQKLPEKWNAQD